MTNPDADITVKRVFEIVEFEDGTFDVTSPQYGQVGKVDLTTALGYVARFCDPRPRETPTDSDYVYEVVGIPSFQSITGRQRWMPEARYNELFDGLEQIEALTDCDTEGLLGKINQIAKRAINRPEDR